MFSITFASLFGALSAVHVIAVALLSSTFSLFFEAGVYGLVPAIVGKENLTKANSALYGSDTVVRIAGTAVAGGLITLFRPSGTIAVDAASYIASAFFIRAVAYRSPARSADSRPGFRESISEGVRFLWQHPTLRIMTAVGTLQSMSGGAIIGQLVIFADRGLNLHTNDPRLSLRGRPVRCGT